ncbi:branched-chain amino acid ABC transporter substrate-binding protein [Desulforhopalus singaporensis]|uniref:Branched-chain amino acid transport system substrate-binding protein n=1 Tax=Desulforhopalus singaporensis TaxID=91360 RepID=A0A1H0PJQ4_9BACT|nr:branched-chain amino acid ABC transporter substrate-binding protein [Desulforhopalus singaporensis]SDP04875.1 branched-chain amino acid transport system substrate-binding protein [Desulforhopalus singaporensis]
MKLQLSGKLLSTAACFMIALSAPALSSAADTIKFGVAGAHSGDLASYGLPTVKAAELVVEKVNANGGINGKKVELLVEDDVCKPEVATNTATKLISDGVDVVLGHICSGATKAALPIYSNAGVLVMSPSATNPALTQSGEYPNFFRTIAPDDAQAKIDVEFALNNLGYTKIAVIHDKGDYGKGFAEFAKKFLEDSGKAEVVLYEGVTPGAVDYSAIVQKIKRSGAQAVMFGGYHPEASKIISMMRKKRLKTDFISDDGVKDNTFIKVAGKDAEGAYASGPKDTTKNPLSIQAVEEHKEKYGADPGAFFENAYSAALAMLNAIEKAGSTDLDALKKALQTEKVDTPVGSIYFDDKGDAIGVGFSVYQVQNGEFVEL